MTPATPPPLFERLLRAVLPVRDRDTVSGDLFEAYADHRSAQGQHAANLWYLRQLLSLVPRLALRHAPIRPLLACVCAFTALCGLWLGAMDMLLHHADIAGHEAIAATIVAQAAITLVVLCARQFAPLRPVVAVGCLALLALATLAIHGLLTNPHFEGYIFLIALALILQVVLTALTFLQDTSNPHLPTTPIAH